MVEIFPVKVELTDMPMPSTTLQSNRGKQRGLHSGSVCHPSQGTALFRSHIPSPQPGHLIKGACPALKIYSLRLPFMFLEEQAGPIWDARVWLMRVWLTLDEGIPQPLPLFPLQAAFMSLGFYPVIGTTWRGAPSPADAGGNVEHQWAGFCEPGLTSF